VYVVVEKNVGITTIVKASQVMSKHPQLNPSKVSPDHLESWCCSEELPELWF
jgi:hypothetical protein